MNTHEISSFNDSTIIEKRRLGVTHTRYYEVYLPPQVVFNNQVITLTCVASPDEEYQITVVMGIPLLPVSCHFN